MGAFLPLILGLGVAAYLLLSKTSTPNSIAGMTADQIKAAVETALAVETDPVKLNEFADACLAGGYPDFANALHARAAALQGQAPPAPAPTPNPLPPPPVPGTKSWRVATLDDVQTAFPQDDLLVTYLSDDEPPHGLTANDGLYLLLTDGSRIRVVSAVVTSGDPQASRGYVVAEQVGTHPDVSTPVGTTWKLSTTDENSAYMDPNEGPYGSYPGTTQYLIDRGIAYPGFPGVPS